MSFKIIRNDITKVKADAIVNSANPFVTFGPGTDQAIYSAAGAEELFQARKKIGEIQRGEVAVTPAFRLQAKYIIHTVGPVWIDGLSGEIRTLESCYKKSLEKALELECESIAFPLLSTGTYGFPKDEALQTAVSVFSRFLMKHDMEITLVVYDKTAYRLSEKLVGEIDSYIDANYIAEQNIRLETGREIGPEIAAWGRLTLESEDNVGKRNKENKIRRRMLDYDPEEPYELSEDQVCDAENKVEDGYAKTKYPPLSSFSNRPTLEEELKTVTASFHDRLLELISIKGMDNKDVWKRANIDRKLFSKIQNNANSQPKKKTVMALCIALKLNLEEATDLMSRASWAFSPSSKFDLIVKKFIVDGKYDINKLNMVLFDYTEDYL